MERSMKNSYENPHQQSAKQRKNSSQNIQESKTELTFTEYLKKKLSQQHQSKKYKKIKITPNHQEKTQANKFTFENDTNLQNKHKNINTQTNEINDTLQLSHRMFGKLQNITAHDAIFHQKCQALVIDNSSEFNRNPNKHTTTNNIDDDNNNFNLYSLSLGNRKLSQQFDKGNIKNTYQQLQDQNSHDSSYCYYNTQNSITHFQKKQKINQNQIQTTNGLCHSSTNINSQNQPTNKNDTNSLQFTMNTTKTLNSQRIVKTQPKIYNKRTNYYIQAAAKKKNTTIETHSNIFQKKYQDKQKKTIIDSFRQKPQNTFSSLSNSTMDQAKLLKQERQQSQNSNLKHISYNSTFYSPRWQRQTNYTVDQANSMQLSQLWHEAQLNEGQFERRSKLQVPNLSSHIINQDYLAQKCNDNEYKKFKEQDIIQQKLENKINSQQKNIISPQQQKQQQQEQMHLQNQNFYKNILLPELFNEGKLKKENKYQNYYCNFFSDCIKEKEEVELDYYQSSQFDTNSLQYKSRNRLIIPINSNQNQHSPKSLNLSPLSNKNMDFLQFESSPGGTLHKKKEFVKRSYQDFQRMESYCYQGKFSSSPKAKKLVKAVKKKRRAFFDSSGQSSPISKQKGHLSPLKSLNSGIKLKESQNSNKKEKQSSQSKRLVQIYVDQMISQFNEFGIKSLKLRQFLKQLQKEKYLERKNKQEESVKQYQNKQLLSFATTKLDPQERKSASPTRAKNKLQTMNTISQSSSPKKKNKKHIIKYTPEQWAQENIDLKEENAVEEVLMRRNEGSSNEVELENQVKPNTKYLKSKSKKSSNKNHQNETHNKNNNSSGHFPSILNIQTSNLIRIDGTQELNHVNQGEKKIRNLLKQVRIPSTEKIMGKNSLIRIAEEEQKDDDNIKNFDQEEHSHFYFENQQNNFSSVSIEKQLKNQHNSKESSLRNSVVLQLKSVENVSERKSSKNLIRNFLTEGNDCENNENGIEKEENLSSIIKKKIMQNQVLQLQKSRHFKIEAPQISESELQKRCSHIRQNLNVRTEFRNSINYTQMKQKEQQDKKNSLINRELTLQEILNSKNTQKIPTSSKHLSLIVAQQRKNKISSLAKRVSEDKKNSLPQQKSKFSVCLQKNHVLQSLDSQESNIIAEQTQEITYKKSDFQNSGKQKQQQQQQSAFYFEEQENKQNDGQQGNSEKLFNNDNQGDEDSFKLSSQESDEEEEEQTDNDNQDNSEEMNDNENYLSESEEDSGLDDDNFYENDKGYKQAPLMVPMKKFLGPYKSEMAFKGEFKFFYKQFISNLKNDSVFVYFLKKWKKQSASKNSSKKLVQYFQLFCEHCLVHARCGLHEAKFFEFKIPRLLFRMLLTQFGKTLEQNGYNQFQRSHFLQKLNAHKGKIVIAKTIEEIGQGHGLLILIDSFLLKYYGLYCQQQQQQQSQRNPNNAEQIENPFPDSVKKEIYTQLYYICNNSEDLVNTDLLVQLQQTQGLNYEDFYQIKKLIFETVKSFNMQFDTYMKLISKVEKYRYFIENQKFVTLFMSLKCNEVKIKSDLFDRLFVNLYFQDIFLRDEILLRAFVDSIIDQLIYRKDPRYIPEIFIQSLRLTQEGLDNLLYEVIATLEKFDFPKNFIKEVEIKLLKLFNRALITTSFLDLLGGEEYIDLIIAKISDICVRHDILIPQLKVFPEEYSNLALKNGANGEAREGLEMLKFFLLNLLAKFDVYGKSVISILYIDIEITIFVQDCKAGVQTHMIGKYEVIIWKYSLKACLEQMKYSASMINALSGYVWKQFIDIFDDEFQSDDERLMYKEMLLHL